ncbi:MAG TPA: aminotransferase class I/II-fold pyridoxal phosphate-dependent enzyme [Acidimicrobiales bacterium]
MSFEPPAYPYERLDGLRAVAARFDGGAIDCSIGTPVDPPPPFVIEELARGAGARGYPPSAGTPEYREAAAAWVARRFGVEVSAGDLAACVGTKEFVASLAGYLHLRSPERDTVLYPSISYPTYAMSATLAGLRAVPVALQKGQLDLESIDRDDAARALVLWANSPSNPSGYLDDLERIAHWGRSAGVLVASDECYCEFTWSSPPRTVLECGSQGVLALHSISKRSNLAGVRAGFYAGDASVVSYLRSVRQHAGQMVPGPVQAGVALAYGDDAHVEVQRDRYRRRLERLGRALAGVGVAAPMPEGSFYLWCSQEGLDGWEIATLLAERSGLVTSPGELYGDPGRDFVRIALVQPDERIELAAARLEAS